MEGTRALPYQGSVLGQGRCSQDHTGLQHILPECKVALAQVLPRKDAE